MVVVRIYASDDYDRTWDFTTPENHSNTIRVSLLVLSDDADLNPCATLLNGSIDERTARLDAERQGASPGV